MSLKKIALQGVFWTFLQQFGTQIVKFVVSIVLARLLMPSEFGLIAMINIFISVGNAFIKSGLSNSLIRTKELDEKDLSTVFFFNVFISFFIYSIVFILAPYISKFYSQPELTDLVRVYSITFIINAFGMVQLARLTQKLNFKTQLLVSLPSLVISAVIGIYMAYEGYGVWSLVCMSIIQSFMSTLQLWLHSKWKPIMVFSIEKFKKHWNFGYKLLLAGLLDSIFVNSYAIIIGKFFAPAQVGFYNRADSLKQLPVTNIGAILNKVTYPLFASIQDDDIRLKSVYKRIMKLVIFLVAPTLFIMAALAEPLIRFLFTEKWLPSVPYFQILCLKGIVYPISVYNLNILGVKGRSDLFLKLEVVKKILLVVILYISFQFGIYGLLIGSVIFSILALFINTHYSGKFINYNASQQARDLMPAIFLAVITASSVYYMDSLFFLDQMDLMRLFGGTILGLTIYLGMSVLFKQSALLDIVDLIKQRS
jgi:O-antigen/teichoic acid export membrane protein